LLAIVAIGASCSRSKAGGLAYHTSDEGMVTCGPNAFADAAYPANANTPPALASKCAIPTFSAEGARKPNEWPVYGGDAGGLKYSPLGTIDRSNVGKLTIAWTWKTGEQPFTPNGAAVPARPGQFQATPIAIGDTLFLSTPFNRVVALDASSGREFWSYDPQATALGQPSNGTGFVHRGVATWSDGKERRILIASRWKLVALDAATGKPLSSFGTNGEVDLTANILWSVDKRHYTNTSPPVVYEDLVMLGNGVGDRLVYKRDPPGDIQAFDVRTGKRVWRFNPIPQPGEYGNETWEDSSWARMGHTNVWAPFTVDVRRGLVYLPFGTPSNDWYGGERHGDNLFAESIVCLDAKTGRRVWHYQITRHGLWDYDLPSPPVLATIEKDGKPLDIVAMVTKQGWVFVFDRVTGQPVWPIEQRPVPASDVPGERAAATQPFPTRPPAFAKQGFTEDDVIDFTPELERLALEEVRKYKLGPLYTPPSLQGTIVMPGAIGGGGWGGGAFDPARGILYVKATNNPALFKLFPVESPSDTVQANYMVELGRSLGVRLPGPNGERLPELPAHKPPYGTLNAIDLNHGQLLWQVPLGDEPSIRNHPALRGVTLPPLLGVRGAPGPMVTASGLVFVTGGGQVLYAIDSSNGKTLWEHDFARVAYSVPMTYATRDGRQFVVVATGSGVNAALVAFSLAR
jgi:quinoprotein glucose dehydrogenase